MGKGPQGPPGPIGAQGPRGLPNVQDSNKIAENVGSRNEFLNRLVTNVANNNDLSAYISTKILQSPLPISDKLVNNTEFINNIGNYISENSSPLAESISNGMISNVSNMKRITDTLATTGTFLSDLATSLTDFNQPYAQYIQGPTGNITDIKSAIQPISLLCTTSGNCVTPRFGSGYLNYTDGNLLLTTNRGTPAFRMSADGKPWITGFSGGQLGTFNNNTGEGTVALKWNTQGDLIDINIGDLSQTSGNFKGTFDIKIDMEGNVIGDIDRTTGSLKINGNSYLYDLYATGTINAKNNMTAFNTQGSSFVRVFMHTGAAGSHKGGSGNTFTIIKNGPYKTTYGGPNVTVLNNFGSPYIFGDNTTSGNIYMLNNNSNMNNLSGGGSSWSKGITGASNVNNAAIINNTGTMEDVNGSLMLIGNAVGDKTNRQVTIKDNLKIGNWELSQGSDGKLQFKKNGNIKMIFGSNGIDVPSNQINKVNIRDNTINGITIKDSNLDATSINVTNSINMTNISSGSSNATGNISSRNIYTNHIIANGGDHSLGEVKVGRYGWGSPNGDGGIRARGEIFVRGDTDTRNNDVEINGDLTVNNSVRSRTNIIHLKSPGSVRASNQLARYSEYIIGHYGGAKAAKIT